MKVLTKLMVHLVPSSLRDPTFTEGDISATNRSVDETQCGDRPRASPLVNKAACCLSALYLWRPSCFIHFWLLRVLFCQWKVKGTLQVVPDLSQVERLCNRVCLYTFQASNLLQGATLRSKHSAPDLVKVCNKSGVTPM